MSRNSRKLVGALAAVAAAALIVYSGLWEWSVCRIEVPAGSSLLLRYKGPFPVGSAPQAAEGSLARVDGRGRPREVGILEAMPGPGRHFYNPFEYETKLVPDVVIEPGKVGVVMASVGKELPAGTSLADEGFKGVRRKVLTPGRYRINPYAYKVDVVSTDACIGSDGGVRRRKEDPALIPPGYVGVVTNKAAARDQPQGIQPDVLQPGLYFINPAEKRVDLISIGYTQTTLMVQLASNPGAPASRVSRIGLVDGSAPDGPTPPDPDYAPGQGIVFTSNDGFPIHLDYTAIWGVLPDQAPSVVRQFGDLKNVDQTVILPQIAAVCRNHGSKRGAVELLVGESREEFQTDTAEELESILESKDLKLLFGLTRHIYVPNAVREPIQKANIADELKLTRDQEQLTAKAQATLTKAKEEVASQEQLTQAETDNKVAQLKAEGSKEAAEIAATTLKLNAKLGAEAALIEAKTTTILGAAAARKVGLLNEARADRYRQYVQTLGGPEAYNRYLFAEKLPEDLRLGIFYAGPGTLWTDLKGFEQVMLGKLAAETKEPHAPPLMLPTGR